MNLRQEPTNGYIKFSGCVPKNPMANNLNVTCTQKHIPLISLIKNLMRLSTKNNTEPNRTELSRTKWNRTVEKRGKVFHNWNTCWRRKTLWQVSHEALRIASQTDPQRTRTKQRGKQSVNWNVFAKSFAMPTSELSKNNVPAERWKSEHWT